MSYTTSPTRFTTEQRASIERIPAGPTPTISQSMATMEVSCARPDEPDPCAPPCDVVRRVRVRLRCSLRRLGVPLLPSNSDDVDDDDEPNEPIDDGDIMLLLVCVMCVFMARLGLEE